MNILALDLGTKTGFAYNVGEQFFCGTWKLATPKEIRAWGQQRLTRRKDPRIEKFCEILSDLPTFDVLVFEDVLFASSTYQVQLWSSLRATAWLCGKSKLVECVPVSTLKKFATGHGNATKQMMAQTFFVNTVFQNSPKLDDNGIDACWLWLWAKQNLARMK